MSESPAEKLSVVVAVSFVAFLSFTYCTAQATETKYLFYGFDLAVVAATNERVRFLDGIGSPVSCEVYSRNVSTKEPPKASPVIVNLSNHHDDDIPFDIFCAVADLASPITIICEVDKTLGGDGSCREVAKDEE